MNYFTTNVPRFLLLSNSCGMLLAALLLACTFAPLYATAKAAPAAKKDSTAARRVLSYAQFVKEMVECTAAVYKLENADLRFNQETDMKFTVIDQFFPNGGFNFFTNGPKRNYAVTTVNAKVSLENISLIGYPILFSNFNFEGGFEVEDTAKGSWEFRDCSFFPIKEERGSRESLDIFQVQSFSWSFFRCQFLNRIRVFRSKANGLELTGCGLKISDTLQQYGGAFSHLYKNTIEELKIDGCTFSNHTDFSQNTFTNAKIENSTFKIFDFSSIVQREFSMDSCHFTQAADFTNAQYSQKNAMLPFDQFAGKFAIQNDTISYQAFSESELADEKKYNKLIALYTDFLSLYKTRGDQESYNACYVEMKQIHTRRAGYLYRKNPTLETWFDWRLNQLLDVFSDYGTNSAKGLIYIFYVIIAFAALYLVFPSEADNLSREKSFRMFDVVIGYFSTNASLVNISEHKRRRALDDLHNFRTTLEVSRNDVPAFIKWLGTPLYGLNKSYVAANEWLVGRFDIVPGKWNELSGGRKVWTGAAVGAYMLGFLIWGVVMRLVNAFALSINAFVTLGYGEIQARGVARYLAVLEGAVGWFLLSIFSVTLISQLLQ